MARKKPQPHHGGAWKVAYADFVTAMMALFMVLWISAQDSRILLATSLYFQSPFNSPLDASSGVLPLESRKLNSPSPNPSNDELSGRPKTDAREIDLQFLQSVAKDFYRLLRLNEDLEDKPIDIQVTSDGMRITLFDRARKPIFKGNTPEFTEWGKFLMQSLAWLIDRHSFFVVIEGHTRKGLPDLTEEYTMWELSADRANAARRALTHYALAPELIQRVSGYGDTKPVPNEAPEAESNQRVSLSLSMGPRSDKNPPPPESSP